jgi:DNA adenine methylase
MIQLSRGSFCTPLRYPGGKGRLVPFVKKLFEANNLCDGHYAEAYAGGAGVAITMLLHDYASCIHINDLNPGVHAFWQAVVGSTDELCRMITDTQVTIQEWERQRAVQARPEDYTGLQLGFSTFFLNRTNRSGIIKAGVIGGKSQSGTWKLDARYNKPDLVQRITKIARLRSRIRIYNLDAAAFIVEVLPTLPDNMLVYLDPPYYVKGEGLYDHFYTDADHNQIAALVRTTVKQPWMVSYDCAPEIRRLYTDVNCVEYDLNYSVQERYQGREMIFFSPRIELPRPT